MSNYLIELSIIHVALILGYGLFLRTERQYAHLRMYLICATLLALTIPLLRLPKLYSRGREALPAVWLEPFPLDVTTISPGASMFGLFDFLTGIYVVVCVFFLCKLIAGVWRLILLECKSSYEKFNDLCIRKVPGIDGSFTFFNWIFLSDRIDKEQPDYTVILKHEKAHATLGHTYDLLFFELFKVCFWWLPTTWFVLQEIKKIHEYQADAYALKTCSVDQYSSILISSTLKSNGLSLASSFHDGLIFKRLKAMKQQARKMSPWKFGLLGSVALILFVVFACSEDPGQKSNDGEAVAGDAHSEARGEIFTVVEALPEYPGGMDALYKYVAGEMKYPRDARLKGVEGRVNVQFVIEKDGSITDVKVIDGIGEGCDDEAVRVVQHAASFSPGMQQGKPVRVRMVMPIIFKLHEEKKNPDNSAQGIIVIEKAEAKNGALKVDANYANGAWHGKVLSPEGDELPGVNIVVTGTTTGTVTARDGTFNLKADESNELFFSFVGYESVRLKKQ
jgi:TonB family protein